MPNVVLDVLEVPKEGCCLRFNPLRSARGKAKNEKNKKSFVAHEVLILHSVNSYKNNLYSLGPDVQRRSFDSPAHVSDVQY